MKPISRFALTALTAAVALVPCALSAQAGGPTAGRGGPDPATMRSATGMLYSGGAIELRPNGQWGLADYPVVIRVDSGSVSAAAGFRIGDVILSVNGRDARDARPFRRERGEMSWVVRVRRGSAETELTMQLPSSTRSASP
jgi:S1-C subfamily serine protease